MIDKEAPNLKEIIKQIYVNDIDKIEGRFIGIIDEISLNEKYSTGDGLDISLLLINSFIHHMGFNFYQKLKRITPLQGFA